MRRRWRRSSDPVSSGGPRRSRTPREARHTRTAGRTARLGLGLPFGEVATLKDFAATYGAAGLVKLRGLVLAALLVRQYGASGYGAYVLGATIAQLIVVVGTFGFGTALVLRWTGIADGSRRRVVRGLVALSSLAAGLLVIIWLIALAAFPALVEEPDLRSVAGVISLTSVASVLTGVGANVYRAQGDVGRFSLGTTWRVMAEVGVVVVAVAISMDVRSLALWSVVAQTIVAVVYGALAYHSIPAAAGGGSPGEARAAVRSILGLGATLASASIAQDVVDRADRLVVAAILGTAAVGIYSAAYAVASAVYSTLPPFTAVLLPRLRDQWQQHRPSALERLHWYLRWFSLATAALGLAIVMFRGLAARVAVGPDAATDVALLTPLLVAAALVYVAGRLTYLPMLLDDNAKGYASSVAWAALANLVLSPLFTYMGGLQGTAVAALMSYLVLGGLSLRQVPAPERASTTLRSSPLLGAAVGALLVFV